MSEHHEHGHGHHEHEHHEHGHIHLPAHMVTRRRALQLGGAGLGAALLAACGGASDPAAAGASQVAQPTATTAAETVESTPVPSTPVPTAPTSGAESTVAPTATIEAAPLSMLPGFDAFEDTLSVANEGGLWLVESNGLPAHNMMVGITSWQQQVPASQPYVGANAWRFPAVPVAADVPVSGKTALYRGAIALAVNGVPIFNALNNRGEDAYLFGELDEWGGHAGRADDYHYHIAPLHLQQLVGAARPIAYALDGYAIYGETEPDGSEVTDLDEFNGHEMPDGSYHYHGTRTFPYINGGLRGVAQVIDDQVEPQPATRPFRPALVPLQGAAITAFESPTTGSYRLEYSIGGGTGEVAYVVGSTDVSFTFTDPSGAVTRETYARG